MQHKINKENLTIALKKSNLNYLEFLTKFVKYHVTKQNTKIDPQYNSIFTWIKNIYNNNQDYYEENTINTLSIVLRVDPKLLIQNNQIDVFNTDYEIFLRSRINNYLKSKTDIEAIISFSSKINTDLVNHLESHKNASNKSK